MRRRDFLRAGGAALVAGALPGCGSAPAGMAHVGVLVIGEARHRVAEGFMHGMNDLGYYEGRTARFTVRDAANDPARLPALVRELLDAGVDLLAAAGGLEADAAQAALRGQAKAVPVVVLYVNGIIERGTVRSRSEAGWAVTGVDNLNAELSGKRVDLLRGLIPAARRILALYSPGIAPSRIGVESATNAAAKFGLRIDAIEVKGGESIEARLAALRPREADALLLVPHARVENALRSIVMPRAEQLGLPVFGFSPGQARAGAVAAYGASFSDIGRQAARLADKVLRGVPPASIPFETPKRYEYSFNAAIARRLGIAPGAVARSQFTEIVESGTDA